MIELSRVEAHLLLDEELRVDGFDVPVVAVDVVGVAVEQLGPRLRSGEVGRRGW